MDDSAILQSKYSRIRRWLACHAAAIIGVASVVAVLGCKNWKPRSWWTESQDLVGPSYRAFGGYGWPSEFLAFEEEGQIHYEGRPPDTEHTYTAQTVHYRVSDWRSLDLDASIALVSVIVIWLLLSRTQRRCRLWWQFSLATLLTFSTLAAAACAVLNSRSLWGW